MRQSSKHLTKVIHSTVREVYQQANRNSAYHPKGEQILKSLYLREGVNLNEFITAVKTCLNVALKQNYREKHPYVDRVFAFTARFCVCIHDHHLKHVDPDTDSPFITEVVNYLILTSASESENVRYRSCQLICKIFHSLIGYDLTVEFCNVVQECLLELFDDKLVKLRTMAAQALAPLQDIENAHCPIIATYLQHMEFDSSANVRRTCAENIATKRDIIPHLIEASNDVDLSVRLAVYKRASKYPYKFKIIHRQELLQNAMSRKEPEMQKILADVLFPAWLQYYEFDHLKLLSSLRLDANWDDLEITTNVCEFLLQSLFKTRPTEELLKVLKLNNEKLLEFDDLTYESVLFWRQFLKHLRKQNGDGIEDFAPQLPEFCDYIKQFCIYRTSKTNANEDNNIYLEFQYILNQLFIIAKEFNYVDVACMKMMCNLIETILRTYNLDLECITAIIENLNIVMPDILKQSKFVCDIIGDFMCIEHEKDKSVAVTDVEQEVVQANAPKDIVEQQKLLTEEEEQQLRRLRLKWVMLEGDLEDAVRKQDYIKASELKPLVDVAKEDFKTFVGAGVVRENPQPETEYEPASLQVDGEHEGEERCEKPPDHVLMKKVLTIMAGFLTNSRITKLNPIIATFKMNVIDEMVLSANMPVKIIAMKCLALCCTLDEDTVKATLPMCCAIILTHNRNAHNPPPAELLWICIGIVADSVLIFGPNLFGQTMDGNETMNTVISTGDNQEVFAGGMSLTMLIKELLELFSDENTKIQELACRSICNFILGGRINSLWIISRLIVKYVTPTTKDYHSLKIQQYIGGTLSKLPSIPNSSQHLEKAILPALKIILNSPPNGPLAGVDVDHTAQVLFHICSQYENGLEIHRNLAEKIVKEIHDKPNNDNIAAYTKMLLSLNYSAENRDYNEQFTEILNDIRDRIHEPRIVLNIVKVITKISITMNQTQNSEMPVEDTEPTSTNVSN